MQLLQVLENSHKWMQSSIIVKILHFTYFDKKEIPTSVMVKLCIYAQGLQLPYIYARLTIL